MNEIADVLSGRAPFDTLGEEDLARLIVHVEVESFAAGAIVVGHGEGPAHLWVVRSGVLEVVENDRVVDRLGPGDLFGPDLPSSASVRAQEESVCLRIPRVVGKAADQTVAGLMRPIVWCAETDRVRDVAERIGAAGLSCALVRTGAGLGIVTDVDFRRTAATGQVGVDAPITALATTPALTIEEDATQATGLLRMIERGVHHLVVVDAANGPPRRHD